MKAKTSPETQGNTAPVETETHTSSKRKKAAKKPKVKKNNSKKESKQPPAKVKEASQLKRSKKVLKIMTDMFLTKSAKFIKFHQAGLSTSEIHAMTGAHKSFIHGVIDRFKKSKGKK